MKWNHILVEGFCSRVWDWRGKHSKYLYILDTEKDYTFDKPEKRRNPNYDPKVKKPKRPKYCKKKICIDCIGCKHLAYSEVDDELLKRFKKMVHEYFEEENRKEFG